MLQRAIGIDELTGGHAHPWVAVEEAHQLCDGVLPHQCVRVEEEEEAPLAHCNSLVIGRRKAAVEVVGNEAHFWEAAEDGGGAAVCGSIVHHDDLVAAGDGPCVYGEPSARRNLLHALNDGCDALKHQVSRVVANNDDGNVDHVPMPPCSVLLSVHASNAHRQEQPLVCHPERIEGLCWVSFGWELQIRSRRGVAFACRGYFLPLERGGLRWGSCPNALKISRITAPPSYPSPMRGGRNRGRGSCTAYAAHAASLLVSPSNHHPSLREAPQSAEAIWGGGVARPVR